MRVARAPLEHGTNARIALISADSLRLAKSLRPEVIYWNTYLPHRGTRGRDWYETHGTIHDEWDVNSLPDFNLRFTLPPAETPAFPRKERIRAWLKCVIETGSFLMLPAVILRALYLSARHGLWSSIPPMVRIVPAKLLGSIIALWSRRRLAKQAAARRVRPTTCIP